MKYFTVPNFLSEDECIKIIDMAKSRLSAAGGFDMAKGQTTITDYRKTDICFFGIKENPFISVLEGRISKLTGIPIENGEGLQYGRYRKGCYYKEHYDFADPKWGGGVNNFLNRGGQRIVTVLIYLNTIPEGVGGQTYFMDHKPPLSFTPKQGMALVFYNVNTEDHNSCDYTTKHAATEITADNIEKHIVTKWFRQNTFH